MENMLECQEQNNTMEERRALKGREESICCCARVSVFACLPASRKEKCAVGRM